MCVVCALTAGPPSFQTPPGKDFNNGSSSWASHSVSNTGSSKALWQHANATAVALPPDVTSAQAISLTISSTLRQTCIRPSEFVELRVDGTRERDNSRSMSTMMGKTSSTRGHWLCSSENA